MRKTKILEPILLLSHGRWKLVQDRFPLKEGELSSQIKNFKPNLHFNQPALT